MNIQQLEYIIALDECRHFSKASEKCFVTQATLSMMIKKLEAELNIRIFDRSRMPVVPTQTGTKIIAQAKVILQESSRLKEIASEEQGQLSGELRIGIIPTLAPYLLPLFLKSFLKKYPTVSIKISELTTNHIVRKLEQHDLDVALVSTPLANAGLREETLFYEPLIAYASSKDSILNKKLILARDIDIHRLCLLEEGHCLRLQTLNLCDMKRQEESSRQMQFETGSIETLKRIVEENNGITILPMLALKGMNASQKNNVRYFKPPVPVREVGLVTYRHFMKEKLIGKLKQEILSHIPTKMMAAGSKKVISA